MSCPKGFAPDVHGPRRAARREPFGTVANAAGGRERNAGNGFCGVFERRRRGFFDGVAFLKIKTRDFGQKKRRAFFGEEARRSIRFFCPKSLTGTAKGVLSQPFAAARP
jgi:hypothetical protein